MWKSVKTPAVTGFLAVYDMGKACSEPARDRGKTKREAAWKAQSSVSAAKCGKERKTDALWKKQAKGADCGKAVFFCPAATRAAITGCVFHNDLPKDFPQPVFSGNTGPGTGFSTSRGGLFHVAWMWFSTGVGKCVEKCGNHVAFVGKTLCDSVFQVF